jgi:hypothetical protein
VSVWVCGLRSCSHYCLAWSSNKLCEEGNDKFLQKLQLRDRLGLKSREIDCSVST